MSVLSNEITAMLMLTAKIHRAPSHVPAGQALWVTESHVLMLMSALRVVTTVQQEPHVLTHLDRSLVNAFLGTVQWAQAGLDNVLMLMSVLLVLFPDFPGVSQLNVLSQTTAMPGLPALTDLAHLIASAELGMKGTEQFALVSETSSCLVSDLCGYIPGSHFTENVCP